MMIRMSETRSLCAALFVLLALSANADIDPFFHSSRFDSGSAGQWPSQTFASDNTVSAPIVNFVRYGSQCQDGLYTFIAPYGGSVPKPGPMILDQDGHLIWMQPMGRTYNMNLQTYKGEDFITFWVGDDGVGHGEGTYYMIDSNYRIRYQLQGANGLRGDLHEFRITRDDTAVYTIYDKVPADLTAAGGPENGWLWDGTFQEVDIETGELLFQWRASEHFDFSEANRAREGHGDSSDDPWDFFHINSVDKDSKGNFLISSRYYNALTYIDGRTGDIIWKLGGAGNMFTDLSGGGATNISWQHHARWVDDGTSITIFDNASRGKGAPMHTSRGLWIDIDQEKMTAEVRHQYWNPSPISSQSQGSIQVLSNDKVLVGYGYNAAWTEFTLEGEPVCEVHLGPQIGFGEGEVSSYRAFKHRWVGKPLTKPSWAIYGRGTNIGYASWNGATEVKTWLLEGSESGADVLDDPSTNAPLPDADITTVLAVPKVGFETVIEIPLTCTSPHLRVTAVDEEGNRLGSSYFVFSKYVDEEESTNILRPGAVKLESVPEGETEPIQDEEDAKHVEENEEIMTEKIAEWEQSQVEEGPLPTTGVSATSILLIVSSAVCALLFVIWGLRFLHRFRRRRGWLGRDGDGPEGAKYSESGRSSLSDDIEDGALSGEDERLIRASEFEIPFADVHEEADMEASRGDRA